MKTSRKGVGWLFIVLALFFTICFNACRSIPAYNQHAWIDYPYPNEEFPAGSPIPLTAHAYAGSGVAEVQCAVDGVPFHRGPPELGGGTFSAYQQDIIINQPGDHLISVTAFDLDGNASSPACVTITITGEEEQPTTTPVLAPSATMEETDTPGPTAITPQAVSISFWADQDSLQQGSCTNLHWSVQHADSVSLDGSGVSASGSRQVCPNQTTSYSLAASGAAGRKTASVTVSVTSPAPADKEAPSINKVTHSPNKIWNFHTCGADSAVVTAKISDASAISSVTIRFRVIKNGQTGSWVEKNMGGSVGTYQITLGPDQIVQSMSSYRGRLEYSVSAEDEHGNRAQSGTFQIEIGDCLI